MSIMNNLNFAATCGFALMLGTAVTLSSCTEEVMNPEDQTVYAPVSVQVREFSVSMEDFPSTRAAEAPSDYSEVKSLTLVFYDSNGTKFSETTQLKGDASTYTTFGQFSFSLPVGNYTLVAIGRNWFENDVFVLTSPTAAAYTSDFPRETFCATQSVSITNGHPLDLSITLNRINTKLAINSTDLRPSGTAKLRTTYTAASKGFNPTTGLATDANGFSVENTLTGNVGKKAVVGNTAFLSSDQQTMDITLEVLDGDGHVVCTKVVPNVPLRRNRITVLEGPIFTPSSASTASFLVETSWLEGNVVTF